MNKFLKSFGFAFQGLWIALKFERNLRIHSIAFLLVVLAGFYFGISRIEWLAILGISALVISLEIINSSIEKLCDLYSIDPNPKIKLIKDIAAGAVLVVALFALIIGLLIFVPYIILE